jgi:hypothetical protein
LIEPIPNSTRGASASPLGRLSAAIWAISPISIPNVSIKPAWNGTTTDYNEAVKYAFDRASALVAYRGDNPYETYPIIIECYVDDENCSKAFSGKWLIFKDGVLVDNIIDVTHLDSDPRWKKLIELYEKDPQSNEFDEYAYSLRQV